MCVYKCMRAFVRTRVYVYRIPAPRKKGSIRKAGTKANVKKERTRPTRKRKTTSSPNPEVVFQLTLPGVTLPVVGEIIEGAYNSTWAKCHVVKLSSNFVHTDALPRSDSQLEAGKLSLSPGMQVQVKLPPLDDQVFAHTHAHTRA